MDVEKNSVNKGSESSSDIPVKPHDEFFGGLVISALALGVLLALGFFAFLGYRIYDQRSSESLSIAEITVPESEDVPESGQDEIVVEEKVPENAVAADAKQLAVSVLNGGGAKGSAGVLADALKKAGFSKTTAGNADGDYSGITVFYQEGQESGAKAVLADIVKQYPKAVVSKVDPNRKETGAAPITVVIGK
jgi:hypothetical protein